MTVCEDEIYLHGSKTKWCPSAGIPTAHQLYFLLSIYLGCLSQYLPAPSERNIYTVSLQSVNYEKINIFI